ncbi:unnamed protein product [Clonostachys chloroleuca]|uniref:Uncharacterized protein n=1 Tax=Clonostachys chloroleuca TaxID=1926264 RepID=A0AA35LY10_9HYPO|nr:unnamed protein product [Clonostachys chloroleuca]
MATQQGETRAEGAITPPNEQTPEVLYFNEYNRHFRRLLRSVGPSDNPYVFPIKKEELISWGVGAGLHRLVILREGHGNGEYLGFVNHKSHSCERHGFEVLHDAADEYERRAREEGESHTAGES